MNLYSWLLKVHTMWYTTAIKIVCNLKCACIEWINSESDDFGPCVMRIIVSYRFIWQATMWRDLKWVFIHLIHLQKKSSDRKSRNWQQSTVNSINNNSKRCPFEYIYKWKRYRSVEKVDVVDKCVSGWRKKEQRYEEVQNIWWAFFRATLKRATQYEIQYIALWCKFERVVLIFVPKIADLKENHFYN